MSILQRGKILVTGGAGFIGSALIWALNQRNIENIWVADYLQKGDKFKNLVPLRFDDYWEADTLLEMVDQKSKLLEEVTTVFHLGACSSTTENDCRYLIQNNYAFTKALAHWSAEGNKRFVYASSAATYGDGDQGMDDRDPRISRLRPLNMYAYSKQRFDLYAQRRGLLEKIVGLKYFNVFGPNEYHKGDMRSVVHKAFEQITQTGQVKLFKSYKPEYKDGEQQRDFLYVKDAVAMTLHLAENTPAVGLFNLGSGQAHTWVELITAIFKALDKPLNIQFIDMPESLRAKYQYYTCADISKLHSTGFESSTTPLPKAVEDYVQNYLVSGKYLGD